MWPINRNARLVIPATFDDCLSYEQQLLWIVLNKENKLKAGDNITLTQNEDGTVTVSSTGGGGGDAVGIKSITGAVGDTGTTVTVTLTDGSTEEFFVERGVPGVDGEDGAPGAPGAQGPAGPAGPAGQGVPSGGYAGQYLQKVSDNDYDTEWGSAPGAVIQSVDLSEVFFNLEVQVNGNDVTSERSTGQPGSVVYDTDYELPRLKMHGTVGGLSGTSNIPSGECHIDWSYNFANGDFYQWLGATYYNDLGYFQCAVRITVLDTHGDRQHAVTISGLGYLEASGSTISVVMNFDGYLPFAIGTDHYNLEFILE